MMDARKNRNPGEGKRDDKSREQFEPLEEKRGQGQDGGDEDLPEDEEMEEMDEDEEGGDIETE